MHLVPLPLILFLGTSQESQAPASLQSHTRQLPTAVIPLSLSQAAQTCCSDCSSPVLQPLITSTASSSLTPTCLEPKTSQAGGSPAGGMGQKVNLQRLSSRG